MSFKWTKWLFGDSVSKKAAYYTAKITNNVFSITEDSTGAKVSLESPAIDITYADLLALSGSFIPEQVYLITDYATTFVYDAGGTHTRNYTGPNEPLFVKAYDSSHLYTNAQSDNFSMDEIHYKLISPCMAIDGITPAYTKGMITYRRDPVIDASMFDDFRTYQTRLWETATGSGLFRVTSDNGEASALVPIFDFTQLNNGGVMHVNIAPNNHDKHAPIVFSAGVQKVYIGANQDYTLFFGQATDTIIEGCCNVRCYGDVTTLFIPSSSTFIVDGLTANVSLGAGASFGLTGNIENCMIMSGYSNTPWVLPMEVGDHTNELIGYPLGTEAFTVIDPSLTGIGLTAYYATGIQNDMSDAPDPVVAGAGAFVRCLDLTNRVSTGASWESLNGETNDLTLPPYAVSPTATNLLVDSAAVGSATYTPYIFFPVPTSYLAATFPPDTIISLTSNFDNGYKPRLFFGDTTGMDGVYSDQWFCGAVANILGGVASYRTYGVRADTPLQATMSYMNTWAITGGGIDVLIRSNEDGWGNGADTTADGRRCQRFSANESQYNAVFNNIDPDAYHRHSKGNAGFLIGTDTPTAANEALQVEGDINATGDIKAGGNKIILRDDGAIIVQDAVRDNGYLRITDALHYEQWGFITGSLKIKLPSSNAYVGDFSIKLEGNNNGSIWGVFVTFGQRGGSGGIWFNAPIYDIMYGTPPFSTVTLLVSSAYDNYIILGSTSVLWLYNTLNITEVIVSQNYKYYDYANAFTIIHDNTTPTELDPSYTVVISPALPQIIGLKVMDDTNWYQLISPAQNINVYTLIPNQNYSFYAGYSNSAPIGSGLFGQTFSIIITTSGTTSYTLSFNNNIAYSGVNWGASTPDSIDTGIVDGVKFQINFMIESASVIKVVGVEKLGGSVLIGSNVPTAGNEILQVTGDTAISGAVKAATAALGDGTNQTEFETDGTLVMKGDATVFGDLDFPIIIRNTGANIPVMTDWLGNLEMPIWGVSDYVQADSQEIKHDWLEMSPLQWHFHIITGVSDASDRYIRVEVEYTHAKRMSVFPAPTTIDSGDLLIPANTPANTHLIFDIGTAWTPTAGSTIATYIKARLKRIAATGTAPSVHYFCDMFQCHYKKDTIGSRSIVTK